MHKTFFKDKGTCSQSGINGHPLPSRLEDLQGEGAALPADALHSAISRGVARNHRQVHSARASPARPLQSTATRQTNHMSSRTISHENHAPRVFRT